MKIRATPGYKDLFIGSASLDELLGNIPSHIVIKILSWLNAQFLHTSAPLERDEKHRSVVLRALSSEEVKEFNRRLVLHAGSIEDCRVFHSLYLTYFLQYELTHFRDIPDIPIGPQEELQIFKAYLLIIDIYNDGLDIPEVELNLPDDEYFTKRIWPMLFKQHEFNRNVDAILELTRLYLLMDELGKSEYSKYLTEYCHLLGCENDSDLMQKILSILAVSNKSKNGNRVSRLENVPEGYFPLLDTLSHRVTSDSEEWIPSSLTSLKEFPLYKGAVGEYHVLNWNFFYRSMHQAILRHFYRTSGISERRKTYGDFKNWVGREITEKRLFRVIVDMAFERANSQPIFPDDESEEKPDAYVVQGRFVVMIECKDTDIADTHQVDFEYQSFIMDLKKKHVKNDKGAPKSVMQLNRNINELMCGAFPKEVYRGRRARDMWVYPVLVCDGYLYSAPGVNEILNQFFDENRTHKTAPLTVITIEYLFRKVLDMQSEGMLQVLNRYHRERRNRRRKLQNMPDPENAFEAFSSVEEVCRVSELPYKAEPKFIREFFTRLGLPVGMRESNPFIERPEQ
jgi:hypothetical protein